MEMENCVRIAAVVSLRSQSSGNTDRSFHCLRGLVSGSRYEGRVRNKKSFVHLSQFIPTMSSELPGDVASALDRMKRAMLDLGQRLLEEAWLYIAKQSLSVNSKKLIELAKWRVELLRKQLTFATSLAAYRAQGDVHGALRQRRVCDLRIRVFDTDSHEAAAFVLSVCFQTFCRDIEEAAEAFFPDEAKRLDSPVFQTMSVAEALDVISASRDLIAKHWRTWIKAGSKDLQERLCQVMDRVHLADVVEKVRQRLVSLHIALMDCHMEVGDLMRQKCQQLPDPEWSEERKWRFREEGIRSCVLHLRHMYTSHIRAALTETLNLLPGSKDKPSPLYTCIFECYRTLLDELIKDLGHFDGVILETFKNVRNASCGCDIVSRLLHDYALVIPCILVTKARRKLDNLMKDADTVYLLTSTEWVDDGVLMLL